jgi:predicted RNase H-like HicB family nuclease
MFKYSINIIWSDEDGGYIATIPEFKNLSAFGETYEKALEEAKVAAKGYIETFKADKLPVPAVHKLSDYSGQTRLRMPKDLHCKLAVEAQNQGISLNFFMVYLLTMNYAFNKITSVKPKTEKQIYIINSQNSMSLNLNYNMGQEKRNNKRFTVADDTKDELFSFLDVEEK